jgi:glycerol-3-phosphate acyltransferase PlsX
MSLPRIAVDAMGGDEGVRVMVEGAALARRSMTASSSCWSATRRGSRPRSNSHPNLRARRNPPRTDIVSAARRKPSQALRRAKTTSMGMAINAVKTGRPALPSAPAIPAR